MEKTKFNFFQQIYTAVMKPAQYFKLSKVGGGRLTGFVFLFVLLLSLFTTVPMTFELFGANGVTKVLHEDLPDFKMANGELTVADRFEKKEGLTYILVDTNIEKFTSDDVDHLYNEVILVSKTNIITYQNSKMQEVRFADLGNLSFDKNIINVILPFIYIIFFMVLIFIYLFMVAGYYITALLYSLVGLIVSGVSHINLPYGRIFKVAIYGKVTASILNVILDLINGLVGNSIPGFVGTLISIIVTCTYVVYGTLSHHNESTQEPSQTISTTNF